MLELETGLWTQYAGPVISERIIFNLKKPLELKSLRVEIMGGNWVGIKINETLLAQSTAHQTIHFGLYTVFFQGNSLNCKCIVWRAIDRTWVCMKYLKTRQKKLIMPYFVDLIIIIVSLLQSTAGHRPFLSFAISLDLRLLASSSCQQTCANRHSTSTPDLIKIM
jgi:ABC-type polysaccharide transport system permease subunit